MKKASVLALSLFSFLIPQTSPEPPRTIHVIVALCDNINQGIVPVPEALGNGLDPSRNLYWGARYGVKTSLKNNPDWDLVAKFENPSSAVLERLVFKRKDAPIYLTTDAYKGAEVKRAIMDFLDFAAGTAKGEIPNEAGKIGCGGNADLICYVGHNGLMDFSLESGPSPADAKKRKAIILACASKPYFAALLRKTGASPLLWTTGLMSPEAYTLIAALDSWVRGEKPETTREKAAQAYDMYQKCGIEGAKKLFATGY